jgi:hypothetical protein
MAMISFELIEQQVKAVFGDLPITIITDYMVNEDAITIKIIDRSNCNKLPSVTAKISALEELQCNDEDECRKLVRVYVQEMRNIIEGKLEERKLLA